MEVEDAMAQLKEAFPSEPEEKLREALRRNGNSCDSAAESVLLGDEGGASSSLATSSWAGPVRENALRFARNTYACHSHQCSTRRNFHSPLNCEQGGVPGGGRRGGEVGLGGV